MKKIHWGGGINIPGARMFAGYPCCCSGKPAQKVRAEGNQTRFVIDVTCEKCKAFLMKAGWLGKESKG